MDPLSDELASTPLPAPSLFRVRSEVLVEVSEGCWHRGVVKLRRRDMQGRWEYAVQLRGSRGLEWATDRRLRVAPSTDDTDSGNRTRAHSPKLD